MKKKFEFLCESFYNVSMKRNQINAERVVSVIGFIFLSVAALLAYFAFDGDRLSIIEKIADSRIVITAVHAICAILIFYTIFKSNINIFIIVLIIESILTMITHYESLGIFFFYGAIWLIFSKDLNLDNKKKTLVFLFILHFLSILGSYPHGIRYMLIDYGISALALSFYLWIYSIFKVKLACYLPKDAITNQIIINKKPGEVISLSDYKLSERHITFVLENLHNNLSYKELSDKYNVSISTVKKVFSEVYKVFNVTKLEELRILLLQYQVEK